ncbi:NADH dehydrogenase subunit 4L, partial [Culex quinquefasciatus]
MSNFLLYYFIIAIFIFGCIVFISTRKHLLCTLLSLEFIVLILFILLFFILNFINYEGYFRMFF